MRQAIGGVVQLEWKKGKNKSWLSVGIAVRHAGGGTKLAGDGTPGVNVLNVIVALKGPTHDIEIGVFPLAHKSISVKGLPVGGWYIQSVPVLPLELQVPFWCAFSKKSKNPDAGYGSGRSLTVQVPVAG
jgi:hypothetical protein